MYCRKCGAKIPDDSLFCPVCGAPQTPVAEKTSSKSSTTVSNNSTGPILKEMKCPNCGAPLNPQPGEAMVVCPYCGTSITLGSEGWTQVMKHFILDIKVQMKDQALSIARSYLDRSILHRHLFEKSEVKELNVSYVPYWIIDAGYSAQYKYKREEVQPGGFVGMSMGRGGGFMGPTMNMQTVIESGTDVGTVKYPVIAVESLNIYQPPDYVFNLSELRNIKPQDSSSSIKMLNGSMGEEKARVEGKVRIAQWEIRRLQKRVHGFLSADVNVDIAEIYLTHIPVWYIEFVHKDKNLILLIDGHNSLVMEEVKD
ncbi:MAG: zinc ribbon domain-containing protein [Thermoplasmata archaeon]